MHVSSWGLRLTAILTLAFIVPFFSIIFSIRYLFNVVNDSYIWRKLEYFSDGSIKLEELKGLCTVIKTGKPYE